MPANCPVCREPLTWTYLLRPLWSRWNCACCGSRLGISIGRRAMLILLLMAMMAAALLLTRSAGGMSEYLVLMAVVAWIPCFVLLDRATVIERAGLRCQGCGYDLSAQVTPRCPECGRGLGKQERALLKGGAPPTPRPGRSRWGLTLLVLLPLLFCVTVGIVMYTRASRAPRTRPAAVGTPTTTQSAPGRAVDFVEPHATPASLPGRQP